MADQTKHQYSRRSHKIEDFTFANTAQMIAGTPNGLTVAGLDYVIVADDVGHIAYKTDDGTYWRLTAIGPPLEWMQIGGAGAGSQYEVENVSGSDILAGQAVSVHTSGVGVVLASAADNTKNCFGLAVASAEDTMSTSVQTCGPLSMSDWTAATGAATLSAHATYYLDTVAGMLTTTPPSAVGNVLQKVGRAASPNIMSIEPEVAVLL